MHKYINIYIYFSIRVLVGVCQERPLVLDIQTTQVDRPPYMVDMYICICICVYICLFCMYVYAYKHIYMYRYI
jgi:hypothetical protein